jgi:serine/threonine-protein kinase
VAEFRAALRPLPPQPARVRVAPATQALPPQPQVAAQPAPAAAPPTTRVAPAPLPQPVGVPTARSIAQSAPTARPRRRVGRWLLGLLLVLALAGGTIALAFPDLVNQYLPGLSSGAQPTPRTLFGRQEIVNDMEVIVPAGTDAQALRQAFITAYTKAVQDKYGAKTIVGSNVPPTYYGGDPQKIDVESNGAVKYRASMTGIIVPEHP